MDVVEMMAEKALKNAKYLCFDDDVGYLNTPLLNIVDLKDEYAEDTVQDICDEAIELLSSWLLLNGLIGTPEYDNEQLVIT